MAGIDKEECKSLNNSSDKKRFVEVNRIYCRDYKEVLYTHILDDKINVK